MIISYRSWQQPTMLSFDLDDTLYDNVPVLLRAEDALQQWLVTQEPELAAITFDKWREYRRQMMTQVPELAHDMTLLRQQTIAHQLHVMGYEQGQAEHIASQALEHFLQVRNEIDVAPEVVALLARLADRYPLLAMTNGNADLARFGLDEYFVATLRPGHGTRMKPFPDMFEQAEARFKCSGNAWLHIGDSLQTDVAGALNAGWQSAWLNISPSSIRHTPGVTSLPHIELCGLEGLAELL